MIKPGGLLPVNVVAEILACSTSHVRNLIKRRELEGVRIGNGKKVYRVIRASLIIFIERNHIDSDSFYE